MKVNTLDQRELRMRRVWYRRKAKLEAAGFPLIGRERSAFDRINDRLCRYLWERTLQQVDESMNRRSR